MPPDLKERVKVAAKANNRSMNAEIVATLEEKYPGPELSESDAQMIEYLLAAVPEHELKDFIVKILHKHGISDEDIRDGLVPGLRLRED
jgi:hypothetical protein